MSLYRYRKHFRIPRFKVGEVKRPGKEGELSRTQGLLVLLWHLDFTLKAMDSPLKGFCWGR